MSWKTPRRSCTEWIVKSIPPVERQESNLRPIECSTSWATFHYGIFECRNVGFLSYFIFAHRHQYWIARRVILIQAVFACELKLYRMLRFLALVLSVAIQSNNTWPFSRFIFVIYMYSFHCTNDRQLKANTKYWTIKHSVTSTSETCSSTATSQVPIMQLLFLCLWILCQIQIVSA